MDTNTCIADMNVGYEGRLVFKVCIAGTPTARRPICLRQPQDWNRQPAKNTTAYHPGITVPGVLLTWQWSLLGHIAIRLRRRLGGFPARL